MNGRPRPKTMTMAEFTPIVRKLEVFCNAFGKNELGDAVIRAEVLFDELKCYTAKVIERAVKHLLKHDPNPNFPTPARIIECVNESYRPPDVDLTEGRKPLTHDEAAELYREFDRVAKAKTVGSGADAETEQSKAERQAS